MQMQTWRGRGKAKNDFIKRTANNTISNITRICVNNEISMMSAWIYRKNIEYRVDNFSYYIPRGNDRAKKTADSCGSFDLISMN